jgi:hypothetical protein
MNCGNSPVQPGFCISCNLVSAINRGGGSETSKPSRHRPALSAIFHKRHEKRFARKVTASENRPKAAVYVRAATNVRSTLSYSC